METEVPDTELFQLDMWQNIQGNNNSTRYSTCSFKRYSTEWPGHCTPLRTYWWLNPRVYSIQVKQLILRPDLKLFKGYFSLKLCQLVQNVHTYVGLCRKYLCFSSLGNISDTRFWIRGVYLLRVDTTKCCQHAKRKVSFYTISTSWYKMYIRSYHLLIYHNW